MKIIDRLTEFIFSFFVSKDGRYPKSVFYASAKTFGENCLELCVFRKNKNKIEIFLSRRSKNDPIWGGLLHIPGIRKLPSETDGEQLGRLLDDIDLFIDAQQIRYVSSITIKNERGTEFADIRYVSVSYNENHSGFYSIYNLPRDIIPFQKKIIQEGLRAYLNENSIVHNSRI